MHLLYVKADGELSFAEVYGDQTPQYAILSHTWIANHEEVTYKDIVKGRGKDKAGFNKLAFCAKQAAKDGLQYFWVDTCCINKDSSAELQEAINSMFRWYQGSTICYVYLADVYSTQEGWHSDFQQSRWFTRGWTLQELLAPAKVEFFTASGDKLGNKISLWEHINKATRIPFKALQGNISFLFQFEVDERLSWAADRKTTREEDAAYSLLGLFDLQMPLLYGEGRRKAFMRLHRERHNISTYEQTHSSDLNAWYRYFDRVTDMPSLKSQSVEATRVNLPKRKRSETFEPVQKRNMGEFSQEPQRSAASSGDPVALDEAEKMEILWHESETRTQVMPEGYNRVAVLLVKWADNLNQHQTKNDVSALQLLPFRILWFWVDQHSEFVLTLTLCQVNDLEAVFRERFNFGTEKVELDISMASRKPQNQMNLHISRFIRENDGPHNLLIVHYIGYSAYDDLYDSLKLVARSPHDQVGSSSQNDFVYWRKTDEMLRADDVEADVLVIFDIAYEGHTEDQSLGLQTHPQRSVEKHNKRYEMLVSLPLPSVQKTATPAKFHYTRVLADALIRLSRIYGTNPFPIRRLHSQTLQDERMKDSSASTWQLLNNSRDILLQPVRLKEAYQQIRARSRSHLQLKFSLSGRTLNGVQIASLKRGLLRLAQEYKHIGIISVDWGEFKPVLPSEVERLGLILHVIDKWKGLMARRRRGRMFGLG